MTAMKHRPLSIQITLAQYSDLSILEDGLYAVDRPEPTGTKYLGLALRSGRCGDDQGHAISQRNAG